MSIDLQLAAVALLVSSALGYVLRSTWKAWSGAGGKGCGSACGKCAAPVPAPRESRRFPLPQA